LFNFHEQQGEDPASTDLKLKTSSVKNWGAVSTDTGDILVDHNTGGTDNLRALDASNNGIEATVTAYLTSEFGQGATPRGQSQTDSAGRWIAPMKLFAGSYTLAFDAPGYQLGTIEQEVE
jgi:hypothetical protein